MNAPLKNTDVHGASADTPHEDPAIEQALIEISKLPQAGHIKREDAAAWLEQVKAREPDRLAWHVRRLRGIGGSEIGAIVVAFRNEYHPFTQAADIIRGKLMIDAPEGPNGDTARGVALEEPLRDLFRPWMKKHYNAVPADDVLAAVQEVKSRSNPWQVGNPDDAFWLPGKKLLMTDYKCPRPDVLAGYEVFGKPFDYICQLHHYTMLAIEAGFGEHIDELCLCSLDSDKWSPAPHFLKYDPALAEEISKAGAHYWNNFVLKGLVPDLIDKPTQTTEDPVLREMVLKAGRTLAMANNGYRRTAEMQELISSYVGDRFFLGKPSIAVDFVDLMPDRTVDQDRLKRRLSLWGEKIEDYMMPDEPDPALMEAELKRLGIDPTKFYTKSKKFDIDKIQARLRAGREDAGRYIRESVKVKLTPLRKGPRGEQFIELREEALAVIDEFSGAVARPAADPLAAVDRAPPKP